MYHTHTRGTCFSFTRPARALSPPLGLEDQAGRRSSLEDARGRPMLVTFAFRRLRDHLSLVVHDALAAAERMPAERTPLVAIVTLDPWRDLPARLPAIAPGRSATPPPVVWTSWWSC